MDGRVRRHRILRLNVAALCYSELLVDTSYQLNILLDLPKRYGFGYLFEDERCLVKLTSPESSSFEG